jgi:hypothetical protein
MMKLLWFYAISRTRKITNDIQSCQKDDVSTMGAVNFGEIGLKHQVSIIGAIN